MENALASELSKSKCIPCEGIGKAMDREEAAGFLSRLPEWKLSEDGKSIFRTMRTRNFKAAVELVDEIADIAEEEGHHPDIHLTDYRYLRVKLSTHAAGGLTKNDFIVAAKIDELLAVNADEQQSV